MIRKQPALGQRAEGEKRISEMIMPKLRDQFVAAGLSNKNGGRRCILLDFLP